jgi:hypothetical protein
MQKDLYVIQSTLQNDFFQKGLEKELATPWTLKDFTPAFNKKLEDFFAAYKTFYQGMYNKAVAKREAEFANIEKEGKNLSQYKDAYYNESLADLVKNVTEKERIIEYNGELIQQINPIFLEPKSEGLLNYRTPFFAPVKKIFGTSVNTYTFDILVIWLMTIILYITLYFELLRKLINSFDKVSDKMKGTSQKKN